MYVSTCKGGANGQYTYVRLMESYRDENGKVKHKVVQNLGRLDILSQSDPNYLENLKKKYQEDYASAASDVYKRQIRKTMRKRAAFSRSIDSHKFKVCLALTTILLPALRFLCCSTDITS